MIQRVPFTQSLKLGLSVLCLGLALTACSEQQRSTATPDNTSTTGSATNSNGTSTTTGTTASYTAPTWAPQMSGTSSTRYYYFPDYNMYYDASAKQYWSQTNGNWVMSTSVPSIYANNDLNRSFVVMLNSKTDPWTNSNYYSTNYPSSYYTAYPGIVSTNKLISNMQSGYTAVPRAYDESTDQVYFLGRSASGTMSSNGYNVPMSSVGKYMPSTSQSYNYGAGVHHK